MHIRASPYTRTQKKKVHASRKKSACKHALKTNPAQTERKRENVSIHRPHWVVRPTVDDLKRPTNAKRDPTLGQENDFIHRPHWVSFGISRSL
jgi:hypothetical protein